VQLHLVGWTKFVDEYKGIFYTDDLVLFCLKYNIKVNGQKRFMVIQYLSTKKQKSTVVLTNSLEKNQNINISFSFWNMLK